MIGLRRFVYLLVITVAAGSALASILTVTRLYSPAGPWSKKRPPHTPMLSANDRSRWCTVWSLVERGTYQIDEIIEQPGWDTIDKGRFRDHFYSSKPPFLATLVAGVYWFFKHAAGLDLLEMPHETVQVILLVVNWLPWLVALALMAAIGERYALTDWSRVFLIVAAAGGTFLTTFLTTLNNHTMAACCVVFALYPTLRIVIDGRRDGWLFAMSGFWGAFAASCEAPAGAFGLALFALLVWRSPGQVLRWFVPAALVPLTFFFYTNWLCTGGLLPFQAGFGAADDTFYKYVHKGVPSYWMNPSLQDQGESSPLIYLFHCTFGHHGIFSLTPMFLLSIAGWFRLGKSFPLRQTVWLSLVLTIWLLAFYLSRTQSYNYGGNTSGLRWAFWLIPLWLVALVPAIDAWGHRRLFQIVCALLLLASVFSATFPHLNPWQRPWLLNVMEHALHHCRAASQAVG
ncbi:MAG TPA: hypothetical protein VKU82_05990 [Planctomycetaceae bacterium]|nr:hypothetical protein [Planctomycetaceae bacterium]